jgi:hypothetical protein
MSLPYQRFEAKRAVHLEFPLALIRFLSNKIFLIHKKIIVLLLRSRVCFPEGKRINLNAAPNVLRLEVL